MKKLLYILIGATLLLTACSDDNDTINVPNRSLEVSTPSVFFEALGGSERIVVAADFNDWELEPSESWINTELAKEGFIITVNPSQQEEWRSGRVHILFTMEGVTITQQIYVLQWGTRIYDDLSVNGSSNCYVTKPNRAYSFDATVRGNGVLDLPPQGSDGIIDMFIAERDVKIEGAYYADLMWEATLNADLTTDINIIDQMPYYRDGRIYFTTGWAEGNAVIAVKNLEGEVLWSWHIWSVEKDVATIEGNGLVWMDRNLGAMNNEPGDNILNRGLIYQWGRKDPFPPTQISYTEAYQIQWAFEQPQNTNVGKGVGIWNQTGYECKRFSEYPGELYHSISAPMTFIKMQGGVTSYFYDWMMLNTQQGNESSLWGDFGDTMDKNIFDPCPAGYRVPPEDAWVLDGYEFGKDMVEAGADGEWGYYWKGNNEFYPVGGYTLAYQGYMIYCGDRVRYWTRMPSVQNGAGAICKISYLIGPSVQMYEGRRADGAYLRCVQE